MTKYTFRQQTLITEIIEKEFATDAEARAFLENTEAMDPEWKTTDMDVDFMIWDDDAGEQV